jgi:hypothetical protein
LTKFEDEEDADDEEVHLRTSDDDRQVKHREIFTADQEIVDVFEKKLQPTTRARVMVPYPI